MRVEKRVQEAVRGAARRLPEVFGGDARLLVAFSGGQDSATLLHALRRGNVLAAHVDHGLRPESAAQAEQVAALAREFGVECVVRRVDVAGYRAQTRQSLQQAARAARYRTLAAVAAEHQAQYVVVAHTADDQAETLLLNLLRGAGLAGLAGMRVLEALDLSRLGPPLPAVGDVPATLVVVRPLLRIDRAATLAYCAEVGIAYVEDASNQSRAYTRNRVRLDLLPLLEQFNPAVREVLSRTADLAGEDLAALEAVVDTIYAAISRPSQPGHVVLDRHAWAAQPRGIQRRLLRRALGNLVGGLVDVPASPIDDALDVLGTARAGASYHLPHGVELCVGEDTLDLRLGGAARPRDRTNTWGSEPSGV